MKKQTKLGLVLAAAAVLSVSVATLVSAKGWVQRGADWYYVDNDGEALTDTIQTSGTAKFYLGEDGTMQRDYFLEDHDNATYYFGSNGAMVTNTWVAVESSRVENQGDRVPDNYWYYFQASGKAMKGTSGNPKRTTIDGKKYAFNEYGQMLTGWITTDGALVSDDEDNPYETATYYAGGENDGVLRTGWVTYYDGYVGDEEWLNDKGNLYFYFNTTNNRKVAYEGTPTTKKINGRTYAFDGNGVMASGWDVVNGDVNITSLEGKTVYFSGDDDGHQVKKGWIYVVPASSIDSGAYDDGEEKYMYFNSSGIAVTDSIKKINGKYYCFNGSGIMKTGIVMWCPTGKGAGATISHYVSKLDMDWAKGEDYAKRGKLTVDSEDGDYYRLAPNGNIVGVGGGTHVDGSWVDATTPYKVKMHYFGDDGARRTGTNNVEFADDTYTFVSNNSGDKGSGTFSKKYYSLGILLKASSDIRYGIYAASANQVFQPQENQYANSLWTRDATQNARDSYLVLTTSGTKLKGAKSAKKDADGNYWVVDNSTSCLRGIFTVNVKYATSTFAFYPTSVTSYTANNDTALTAAAAIMGINTDVWSDVAACGGRTGVSVTSTIHGTIADGGYYTHTIKMTGYWYQSDYGDSSNKWIPFGVNDASGRTASFTFDATNPSEHFQVEPNDDYFLNCTYSNA